MNFPRPSKSPGELLGGLKDRLGFREDGRDRDDYYDRDYSEDSYEYDSDPSIDGADYGSYAYDPDYDDQVHYGSTRQEDHLGIRSPRLVSSEDVRATTSAFGVVGSVSERPRVSSYSSAAATSVLPVGEGQAGFDEPVGSYGEFVSPYKEHADAAARASSPTRVSGLDQLFTPTTEPLSPVGGESASTMDPYTAYESNDTAFSRVAPRGLSVIKPIGYQDVEGIARSVRAGDVVVLSLRVTNADLSKRVLDFSFGVASALDARVECVAEKVFIVARGGELNLEEKHRLHQQGIL